MNKLNIALLTLLGISSGVFAWESEQLEVFDVVEEVKQNFYEMLEIPKDANSSIIRSAFKRHSVKLHPDKNLNEDTSEKFRNLVSVYEVLKDSKKRGYYDDVLVNGMPNWKSAMYYYRRVRKVGILEGFIIIFFIVTIGQYLVSWAAYFEHKFNQFSISEQNAKTRKAKKNQAAFIFEEIPKPSMLNTLPFQIPYVFYLLIISLPSFIMYLKDKVSEKVEDVLTKEPESESEEEVVEVKEKRRKKKPGFAIPEGPTCAIVQLINHKAEEETIAPPISGGLWTDDDLEELVQLVKKYPGGTPKRWVVIGEAVGRSVAEVTYMANKMKSVGFRPVQEEEVLEERVKLKTKGKGEEGWSQPQQRALEDALARYGKGAAERWERIAEAVPEKTKEECVLRYRHLVEVLKNKKQKEL